MDPLTLVIALLAVATVVGVGSGVRVAAQLRVAKPGPERDALLVSRWSLAGSMAICLSIAMGLPFLSLPMTLRWTVLGGAVALIAVGTIESKRLAAVRRQELAREVDTAVGLIDRVEALEAQQSEYQRLPARMRFMLAGGKLMLAFTVFGAMSVMRHPTLRLVLGGLGVAQIAWLGWDIFTMSRRRQIGERIDSEIAALLAEGSAHAPDPERSSSVLIAGEGPREDSIG